MPGRVEVPVGVLGPRIALDLWHPTGVPGHRLALGAAAAVGVEQSWEGPVDLAVIAPERDQLNRAWLERAIATAAARLATDGILWVIVPRIWRRAAERGLSRSHLVLLDSILTVPRWPETAHLVPIAPATLGYAGARHLGLPRAASAIVGAATRIGIGRALVRRSAPGCALVASRRPPPEPLAWLAERDAAELEGATVSISLRRDARVAVVMRFRSGQRRPDLVAKVATDEGGRHRLQSELANLEALGAGAARAGAVVPTVEPSRIPWLLMTRSIAGEQASNVLARHPRRLEPLAGAVATWLQAWCRETAAGRPASDALLETMLLGPAARVLAAGEDMADYRRALHELAGRLRDKPIICTAAHNDLTMANVIDSPPGIGIIDWEEATSSDLPLRDLWYASADALARACRLTHAQAVQALVLEQAPAPPGVTHGIAEHARALSLTPDQALLGFHACWLGHASNELLRGYARRPFTEVVRAVATRRLLWPGDDQPAR